MKIIYSVKIFKIQRMDSSKEENNEGSKFFMEIFKDSTIILEEVNEEGYVPTEEG